MKWIRMLRVDEPVDVSVFKMQPIVQAAFSSGSLTAAFLNLSAVAALAVSRRIQAILHCMRDEECCSA